MTPAQTPRAASYNACALRAKYLNSTALTPNAGFHLPMCTHGKIRSRLLVGLDLIWSLSLTPSAVYWHAHSLNSNTSLHFHAPALKPSNACQQPGLLQLPVHLPLAPALAAGSGSHHCVCVYNWLLPLHRDPWMTPATKCAQHWLQPQLLLALVPSY